MNRPLQDVIDLLNEMDGLVTTAFSKVLEAQVEHSNSPEDFIAIDRIMNELQNLNSAITMTSDEICDVIYDKN